MMERWKTIPEFDRYEASTEGRVRVNKPLRSYQFPKGHILCGTKNKKNGYYYVMLTGRAGKRSLQLVHKLILNAFRGPRPPGHVTRHMDGVRTNNRISNLRWGTPSENEADKKRHGTNRKHSKLNSSDVSRIKNLLADGASHVKIGSYFDVHPSTISAVATGRTWRHIR